MINYKEKEIKMISRVPDSVTITIPFAAAHMLYCLANTRDEMSDSAKLTQENFQARFGDHPGKLVNQIFEAMREDFFPVCKNYEEEVARRTKVEVVE